MRSFVGSEHGSTLRLQQNKILRVIKKNLVTPEKILL